MPRKVHLPGHGIFWLHAPVNDGFGERQMLMPLKSCDGDGTVQPGHGSDAYAVLERDGQIRRNGSQIAYREHLLEVK